MHGREEKALHLAWGTPEDSYSKLPNYLHMLQLRNPGTIMDFVVEDGRFKYCFFSLGSCVRGFRFCRPVVCVDGSFLKTRYGGQMLCAVALDVRSHIFSIAFAIIDNIVFPDAHHDACYHHIIMNVNHKFKTNVFTNHIYTCAYTYSKLEFHKEFENIRAMNVAVAQYLEEIGFEKFVWSYFSGVRYNVMTRNWVESFNNTTKDATGFSIIAAIVFLRSKVQQWFATRKEKADKPYMFQVHLGGTVQTGVVVDLQE
ncbi:uncharacterized protein LOC133031325 [Cannabis sativa]|uniref:uncharacterized protein LOC133031325 n=1 Tax=Cannabis sativa TaxID=3483 RepID=UPI0029CA5FDD|nr:uncharacterized protein LOC133031325 [Cannabis sativa]